MLLTLEGIDGSGKTTAARALADRFEAAVHTAEPTDSWYGDAVRRSVREPEADPLAELFLYVADHADHLARTVEPTLEADRHVISDRYVDSRYAYQAATLADRLDEPLEYVRRLHRPWTVAPDATLYFDVDPTVGAERSGSTNKFETATFLERVQANYETLIDAEPDRFHRIDAGRPREAVVAEAVALVGGLLDG